MIRVMLLAPCLRLEGPWSAPIWQRTPGFRIVVIGQEVLLILAPITVAIASEQWRRTGAVVRNKPFAHLGERGRCGLLRPEDFSNTHRGWKVSMNALDRRLCRITCAGVLHTTNIGSPANEIPTSDDRSAQECCPARGFCRDGQAGRGSATFPIVSVPRLHRPRPGKHYERCVWPERA